MKQPTHKWTFAAILAIMAIALAACNNTTNDDATEPETQPPAAEQPSEQPGTEPQTEPEEQPGNGGGAAELPKEKSLEVTVEGQKESVPAVLTESELGYAFYLMENFEFSPEEPGKDIIFHKSFPEFFARIEPMHAGTKVEDLRANAQETLKAVGDNVTELKGDEIPDPTIREKAEFYLHVTHPDGTVDMLGIEYEDTLYRITFHFPNGEAAEGVPPRFYPMINSIVDMR